MSHGHQHNHIASRYVTALFELAEADKKLDKTHKELTALGELLADSAAFDYLCKNPTLGKEAQLEGLAAITKKTKLSKLVSQFLIVLANNRRVNILPSIIEAFNARLQRHNGQIVAHVTSAIKLKKPAQTKLAKMLSAHTGKDVLLNVIENPAILGGLRIHVDGHMIDASVEGRLNRLKENLHHGIRQIA